MLLNNLHAYLERIQKPPEPEHLLPENIGNSEKNVSNFDTII